MCVEAALRGCLRASIKVHDMLWPRAAQAWPTRRPRRPWGPLQRPAARGRLRVSGWLHLSMRPGLLRPDWAAAKLAVMAAALRAKVRACCAQRASRVDGSSAFDLQQFMAVERAACLLLFCTACACTSGKACTADGSLVHYCLSIATLHATSQRLLGGDLPIVVSEDCCCRVVAALRSSRRAPASVACCWPPRPSRWCRPLPHVYFWGRGVGGNGGKHLGLLLTRLCEELEAAGPGGPAESLEPGAPGGWDTSA